MENTSGQGKDAAVPKEIDRWNWGAFFLGFIWGIPHRVYSSLFGLLPVVTFVMPFVLGAKGSAWAWQNKPWESVDQFKRAQRQWALWGIVISLVLVSLMVWGAMQLLQEGDLQQIMTEQSRQQEGDAATQTQAPDAETAPSAAPPPAAAPAPQSHPPVTAEQRPAERAPAPSSSATVPAAPAAAASTLAAESTALRSFALAGHGALQLLVPQSWKTEVRQPDQQLPPTLIFTASAGPAFQVLITPMYALKKTMRMPDQQEIQASVAHAAADAQKHAVEPRLSVKVMRGAAGEGFYFSATEKTPKPEQFKKVTQGELRVGELAPLFTILTNDDGEAIIGEALAMLATATHQAESTAASAASSSAASSSDTPAASPTKPENAAAAADAPSRARSAQRHPRTGYQRGDLRACLDQADNRAVIACAER